MTSRGRIKADVAINVCFMVLNSVALMWAVRTASIVFAPATLGAFLLARRLSSICANFLQLGMSQTLMRYLPMNADAPAQRRRYVLTACVLWAGISLGITPLLGVLNDHAAARAFPGVEEAHALAKWGLILALVMVLQLIVHATLLAERRMLFAKTVEFVSVSVFLLWPLLLLGGQGPAAVLEFQAVGIGAISLISLLVYLFLPHERVEFEASDWSKTTVTFLTYGVPRGLITGFDAGILAIGPWLLRTTPEQAGYLVIALMLVQFIQAALNPVTQVASVVAARFVGRNDQSSLRNEIRLLLGVVTYATILGSAIFVPWSGSVLRAWLKDPTVVAGVQSYVSWLALGLVPVAIYQGMRGIIEMRWFGPRNLLTLILAGVAHLGTYAVLLETLGPAAAVKVSLVITLWILGILTLVWLGPSFLRPLRYWGLVRLMVGAVVLLALNEWFARGPHTIGAGLSTGISVAIIAVALGFWAPAPVALALRSFVWSKLESRS
jgi:hypothetical protein